MLVRRRWRGGKCGDVEWGPVGACWHAGMADAASQTDPVLSLSLVTPATRQFYDYFYKTLSKSGMRLVNKIIQGGDSELDLPRPRPFPGRLPLFRLTGTRIIISYF